VSEPQGDDVSEPAHLKRRRLDRVLDRELLADLPAADADALRRLRGEADQEEAELSYVRRLLQGRLDQLRNEQERRGTDSRVPVGTHTDSELVQMLSSVLAGPGGGRRSGDAGGGRYLNAEADPESQRRRAAEVAAADVRLSDPGELDDDELAAARGRLAELESQVSAVRRDVQVVADAIAAELTRRDEL